MLLGQILNRLVKMVFRKSSFWFLISKFLKCAAVHIILKKLWERLMKEIKTKEPP